MKNYEFTQDSRNFNYFEDVQPIKGVYFDMSDMLTAS